MSLISRGVPVYAPDVSYSLTLFNREREYNGSVEVMKCEGKEGESGVDLLYLNQVQDTNQTQEEGWNLLEKPTYPSRHLDTC